MYWQWAVYYVLWLVLALTDVAVSAASRLSHSDSVVLFPGSRGAGLSQPRCRRDERHACAHGAGGDPGRRRAVRQGDRPACEGAARRDRDPAARHARIHTQGAQLQVSQAQTAAPGRDG